MKTLSLLPSSTAVPGSGKSFAITGRSFVPSMSSGSRLRPPEAVVVLLPDSLFPCPAPEDPFSDFREAACPAFLCSRLSTLSSTVWKPHSMAEMMVCERSLFPNVWREKEGHESLVMPLDDHPLVPDFGSGFCLR